MQKTAFSIRYLVLLEYTWNYNQLETSGHPDQFMSGLWQNLEKNLHSLFCLRRDENLMTHVVSSTYGKKDVGTLRGNYEDLFERKNWESGSVYGS